MTIKEAQNTVDEWIKAYGVRYFSELTNMAVLTEEVGELARVNQSALRRAVMERLRPQKGRQRQGCARRRDGRRTVGTPLSGQSDRR